jgi:hypothetical protein
MLQRPEAGFRRSAYSFIEETITQRKRAGQLGNDAVSPKKGGRIAM